MEHPRPRHRHLQLGHQCVREIRGVDAGAERAADNEHPGGTPDQKIGAERAPQFARVTVVAASRPFRCRWTPSPAALLSAPARKRPSGAGPWSVCRRCGSVPFRATRHIPQRAFAAHCCTVPRRGSSRLSSGNDYTHCAGISACEAEDVWPRAVLLFAPWQAVGVLLNESFDVVP